MTGNGLVQLTAKDFKSDQEVRWCPGCGDYAILAGVQSFLPELGIPRENLVFVSGIGCAARFPYYVQSYGMHSIHGRAPAIATGLATTRPDLSVWVVTGDGDALSIGGNHLIHALRRNVNVTILLFNNRIYGLTKGQYSPTSERGKVTKSTPLGSVDQPFNPLSIAIGAEATFVARAIDTDKQGTLEVLRAAAAHRGAAFVEILQNCNIYNDGAFDVVREEKDNRLYLRAGEEVRWGEKGVRMRPDGTLEIGRVMDDDVLRRHLGGRGDAEPEPPADDGVAALVAEQDRLAVLHGDHPRLRLVRLAQHVEGAVVEDRAVLVDLDQRGTAVPRGGIEDGGQPGPVGVHRPAHERRLRAQRQ